MATKAIIAGFSERRLRMPGVANWIGAASGSAVVNWPTTGAGEPVESASGVGTVACMAAAQECSVGATGGAVGAALGVVITGFSVASVGDVSDVASGETTGGAVSTAGVSDGASGVDCDQSVGAIAAATGSGSAGGADSAVLGELGSVVCATDESTTIIGVASAGLLSGVSAAS